MANYQIKSGDTLSGIAKKYGVTVNDLVKANNIKDANKIYAGNSLVIPGSSQSSKSSNKSTTNKSASTNVGSNTAPKVPDAVKASANQLKETENSKPTYNQSNAVTEALGLLTQAEGAKPGAYQSSYTDQINSLLGQIQNRQPFSYNMNADPLYQQYKTQYTRQADLAMRDAIGNTSALTGGYGSTYGTVAGSQAYDSQIANLNNVIPELYNAALNKYNSEGTDLYNQLGAVQGQDQIDYGRYSDSMNDYRNDLNYYYTKYNDMSSADYNKYLNDLSTWQNDRSYYYGKNQDAIAQDNYQNEFAYQQQQDALSQQNWLDQFGYQKQQDAQAQSNWQQQYNYQQQQDSLAQQNWQKEYDLSSQKQKQQVIGTGLKGSSGSTTNTTSAKIIPTQDYTNTISKVANEQGLDKAIEYISTLYDTNRISEKDFETLYNLALGIVAKKTADSPLKNMNQNRSILGLK